MKQSPPQSDKLQKLRESMFNDWIGKTALSYHLDIAYRNKRISAQDLEDCYQEIKDFLSQALDTYADEVRRETLGEAYKIFLKAIRDAKQKFTSNKEFQLVVDVRDIEIMLQTEIEKR